MISRKRETMGLISSKIYLLLHWELYSKARCPDAREKRGLEMDEAADKAGFDFASRPDNAYRNLSPSRIRLKIGRPVPGQDSLDA